MIQLCTAITIFILELHFEVLYWILITSNNTYGFSQYLTTWQVINCEYQTNSLILQLPTGWQVEQTILFSQLLNQLN